MSNREYRINQTWTERRRELGSVRRFLFAAAPEVLGVGGPDIAIDRSGFLQSKRDQDEFASDVQTDVVACDVRLGVTGDIEAVGVPFIMTTNPGGEIMDPVEGLALAKSIAQGYEDRPTEVDGLSNPAPDF